MKKLHLSIALALIALFSFASLAPTPVYGRSTTDKPAATAQAPAGAKPVALTDDTVIKYLEASVMILKTDNLQQGWMGSGTVLYQDMDWAYVLTCAHLFDDANQKECGIRFFYKNGAKLDKSLIYKAEILGMSHKEDLCFIRFKADYDIPHFRIAPRDWTADKGDLIVSCGFDQREGKLAAYNTYFDKYEVWNMGQFKCDKCGQVHSYEKSLFIISAPGYRHGRSGGGSFSKEGYMIGVCSRGSEIEFGTGNGGSIKVADIHDYAKKLGLEFVLDGKTKTLRESTVQTKNGEVPGSDYIPVP